MVALKDFRDEFRLSLIDSSTNDWAYNFNEGYNFGILLDGKLVYKSNSKEHIETIFNLLKDSVLKCRKEISKIVPCI